MSPLVSPARVLVLDDAEDVLLAARLALKRHFAGVETLRAPAELIPKVKSGGFDVILLDMNFHAGADTGREGLSLMAELNEAGTTVVMVTHSHAHAEYAHRIVNMLDGAIVTEQARQFA